jgi:alpha-1,3-rhamnosyltransferase
MQNIDTPLVSIVVITYNSSRYVLETLESARAQTYQNIELIVSDDCSTDNTPAICREWVATNKDRFVRAEVITTERNTGIAANCNRGYSAAHGEWIKGIAGDDVLMPECIECYIQYANEHPDRKILLSKLRIINQEQITHKTLTEEFWEKSYTVFDYVVTAQQQNKYLIRRGNFVPIVSMLVKKEVWTTVDGFDEEILFLEDYPFLITATRKGYVLTLLSRELCKYRFSASSTQLSSKNIVAGKLCLCKYIDKTPFFQLILPHVDQFDMNKGSNKFWVTLLYITSFPMKIIRKLRDIGYKYK